MPLLKIVAPGNFGDDLNDILWNELFLDLHLVEHPIYGVGTILPKENDPKVRAIVLGSGVSSGIDTTLKNTDFRWVRGPLTARSFRLPTALGLGDPAILWPYLYKKLPTENNSRIGFIPHHGSWSSYNWLSLAERSGLFAISPFQTPQSVADQISQCSRILTESLHGAIFADTIGVPWAPCVLAHRFTNFKWLDWSATIKRSFDPLIVDRSLVHQIKPLKATVNRLAKLFYFNSENSYPHLRPTTAASFEDECSVASAIANYVQEDSKFHCSTQAAVKHQRSIMLEACSSFASEYKITLNPKLY